jgi:hypothetical protein
MNREQTVHEALPAGLPTASGRRLSNQIGRAFHGTFGAMTGLQILMRSVAAEMLAAGASEQCVAQALEACVMNHPARTDRDSSSLMSGRSRSAAFVALANECIAAVARSNDVESKERSSRA